MTSNEQDESATRRRFMQASIGAIPFGVVAFDKEGGESSTTKMSLGNRLEKAVRAFIGNPDRVVYLTDSEDGDSRKAIMGSTVTVGESDSDNLSRLASSMGPPDEDTPGIKDRYPENDRE